MEFSTISWCDNTFNPWEGCTRVSPGCTHCYAETRNKRFKGGNWGPGAPRRVTSKSYWNQPLKWQKKAEAHGERLKVFCGSLCDVFDQEGPKEVRSKLFGLIRMTPNLDWLVLTKRPQNIAEFLPADWGQGWPNVWLGTTTEDRQRACERIPLLQSIPAQTRFLSVEPQVEELGLIDLRGVAWVIVGGESGAGARPFDAAWAASLQRQCSEQGVAFFFKQLGSQPFSQGEPLIVLNEKGRSSSHAGDFAGWPRDLSSMMVREFPSVNQNWARLHSEGICSETTI